MRGWGIILVAAAAWAQAPSSERITPGVFLHLSREAPPGGAEEFTLAGQAGQTLLVQFSAVNLAEGGDQIAVYAPGESEKLPNSLDQGDSIQYTHWLNRLKRTGVYRIAIQRKTPGKYDIEFRLLEPSDPVVNPGIKGISGDFTVLGGPPKFAVRALQPEIMEFSQKLPAAFEAANERFYIAIRHLEGMRRMSNWPDIDKILESAVRPHAPLDEIALLPTSGGPEAEYKLLLRPKALEGISFRAVRWLGKCVPEQDESWDPFDYHAQGISRDGRFYLLVLVDISHAATRALQQKIIDQNIPSNENRLKTMKEEAERRMTSARPSSFEPDLDRLDAMVRSIRLR